MGKKRSWLSYLKRFFSSESKQKAQEKSKKWTWFVGRFRFKQYPALEPPQETLNEASEQQRKQALAVAIATAAAAEAAVAAANAAAEFVRLTNIPYQSAWENQNFAAIRIQSAYRRHLARKALSALKGLVKLQAVIRGDLVRRRIKKLTSISAFGKLESQAQEKKASNLCELHNQGEKKRSTNLKEMMKSEEPRLQCNSDRIWDFRLVSKEDIEALWLRKQEAIIKRERMKQYSFSHRERRNDQTLLERMRHKESQRQRSQFDYWEEVGAHKKEDADKLKPSPHLNILTGETNQLTQLKLRNLHKQDSVEDINLPFSLPRRSFCNVKKKSIGDDNSLPNSPVFPSYMAATESLKAKSRSLSMPKQRMRLCDTYSGQSSPYKLSSWSSFNSEMTRIDKRGSISQHIQANLR